MSIGNPTPFLRLELIPDFPVLDDFGVKFCSLLKKGWIRFPIYLEVIRHFGETRLYAAGMAHVHWSAFVTKEI